MRVATVASLKGGCGSGARRAVPAEGSKLRKGYDAFVANKGIPIDLPLKAIVGDAVYPYCQVDQLRNYYGLNIRKISRGRWVLAGEWCGKVYVDYIAERLNAPAEAGAQ